MVLKFARPSERDWPSLVRQTGSCMCFCSGCRYWKSSRSARLQFDGELPIKTEWDYAVDEATELGVASVRSGDVEHVVAKLGTASHLLVEVAEDGIGPVVFNLTGLFDTPIQRNLDYCGDREPAETGRQTIADQSELVAGDEAENTAESSYLPLADTEAQRMPLMASTRSSGLRMGCPGPSRRGQTIDELQRGTLRGLVHCPLLPLRGAHQPAWLRSRIVGE